MALTDSQRLAVESRGGARLVSAAAGSGKTRVLVERLLRYVDDGADIDEFLVITFTRAAAAELRSRILSAIGERIAADPGNRRLRRQTELCCRAGIGTIDSLCGRFLRENVHLAGLAPDYRVLEEGRADALRRSVLDRLLDRLYEGLDERPGFQALIDSVGAGRDDGQLAELTLSLHTAVQSHPDPARWLTERREELAQPADGDAGGTPWGAFLLSLTAERAGYWAGRMEALLADMAAPDSAKLMAAYGDTVAASAEGLRALHRACGRSWDAAGQCARVPFPRAKPYRGDDPLADRVKLSRDACRDACRKLEKTLAGDSAQLLDELARIRPATEALLELTAELERAYAAEKRRQGVVDLSDQEHLLLRLLENGENGLAKSLSRRFREVLVDEYQDVNECQDRLFTLLSGGGSRLFMVGDVKQSIYRFRLADPSLFLSRYDRYAGVGPDLPAGEPGRILLRENFRSRPELLSAVNHVFSAAMSRELGELDYDGDAALRAGREYPAAAGCGAVLDILTLPEGEDEERPDKAAAEAAAVARRIRQLVDDGVSVTEGEALRPARWGDFAILLRAQRAVASRYRAALAAEGIPAVTQQGGGFFRSLEVTVLLSLLAIIDNPRQDVPLIAVLRSPLFGFTPDELSAIRARDRKSDYYTALCAAAGDTPRCAAFLAALEGWRALSPDLSVEALLERVCAGTDLFALLTAMADGQARRENVQALLDYARQFEQDGYRGIFGFLGWMRRLNERGREPRVGSVERRDAVQIMSIHGSKGLEFPIVFLADTGRQFNKSDRRRSVLIHPKLGVGAKVTDAVRGLEYPSLAWRAVAARLEREALSEELRVLYVAMTRAKDRLYVSCLWPTPEKRLEKLGEGLTRPIAPQLLEGDASLSHWLARAALLPESPLALNVSPAPARMTGDEAAAEPETAQDATPEELARQGEELRARLSWVYPHAWAQTLPSKLTASALREETAPDDGQDTAPPPPRPARLPALDAGDPPLTGAERGTATHALLQFLDLSCPADPEAVAREKRRLLAAGHLSPRQALAVDAGRIVAFLRSETARRIRSADRVWRELRFSLLVPAESCFDVPAGEEILLQGVADCCLREGDALTVIDYKTDRLPPEALAARAAEYAPQLRAYAAALSRVLGLPVREAVLYFLFPGRTITVPLPEPGEASPPSGG